MIDLPPKLDLAQIPTPLQLLNRVSKELGVNIWVKRDDLTGSVLSGNKVRKLEFSLAQALREGCDHIITCGGLQSNHCRATALLGAQLGLSVTLVLRGHAEEVADGNFLLDRLSGATIKTFAPRDYTQNLTSILEAEANAVSEQGGKAFVIPTGASDGVGIWGYVAAAKEMQEDFNRHRILPSHVVMATGSGGTQAGLSLGAHLLGWETQILGMAVCDDENYFLRKVREDIDECTQRYGLTTNSEDVSVSVNDRYVGPGYAQADDEVFEMIAKLASTEGIVLDPVYTGKAFYGLVSEIKSGRLTGVRDVVFVHTGGVFGNFPFKQRFA
ncbi:MAG: D-cysteine desulfhydrase [Cellvibrionaceae bacterium]|nr:D-cysteine desulfhydrase [Cellvibrionaceae bacterium]|tara:strand:- start:12146 stop:13129 length:984 start_codon:yes stop_codon:yes gene_type:complete